MDNEQYLTEVQKALDNDTTRLGDVWRLTNEGKSVSDIATELGRKDTQYSRKNQKHIQAITDNVLPDSPTPAKECKDALRGFINRHRNNFSAETIHELERRATECNRRANNRQVVQQNAKGKKGTNQVEESFEKFDIAGIYVYTYPKYYDYPDVQETDDIGPRILLKIGMSEKDACKRIMQQTTGMPERPMILQIWKVENNGDLREIEKKIHEHLHVFGHHSSEGREWFLTNEQCVTSTANLLGLACHFDHRKPKTDD